MLVVSCLTSTIVLSASPAATAAIAGDVEYCHSDYVIGQNPYCTPLPPDTKDYRGEPIAVQDKIKATGLNCDKYVNVLRNDVVEKKSKVKRLQITYQRPKQNGIHASVQGNKIRLRFVDVNWGGQAILYRVVDAKGRKSAPTHLGIQIGFGYQGGKTGC
ncbi:hypothetical protein Pve01_94020 [Planomonospora venezuelensis]|nr:hypothetical protein Pve01_94020 [Planomonospora venezuelensis]